MLQIDGGGYDTATEAFVNGNQLAAMLHGRLTGRLASYAAMAGTDSGAEEFAAAYDVAAREAVHALADLVDAFAGVGRVTAAAVTNHRVAEARSVIAGASVYDGGTLPDDACVAVLPSTPPSSLGGDAPGLPAAVDWVIDHVQGAVCPDADLDRLRAAARTWTAAAESLDDLVTCCDSAVRGFWGERSPEIPLAIAATRELEDTVRDLAAQYAALASACTQYADHVEHARDEVIRLAEWLLEQLVEGVLISAAIGALTGGAAAGVSMSAVLARLAAESPRFARIIETLRSLAAAVASGVRGTRDAVAAARVRLVKFARARAVLRDEAGTIRLPGPGKGWLARHEHSGSHTLRDHVGKTDADLMRRFSGPKPPRSASTFPDEHTAERAIAKVVQDRRSLITDWLAGDDNRRAFQGVADKIIGRTMDRAGNVEQVRGVRVVLDRDPTMPDGFRIFTAYPTP